MSFVTGFLGSGKTTLISALLRHPDMHGTAIIVNEFGAVGLDDAIFAQTTRSEDIKLLANGCMCCVADDELAITLLQLIHRAERIPTRIVIETTGLADPANLLHKIMIDPRIRPFVRLDGVITTVDAVNGSKTLINEIVAQRQAAIADVRMITKSDLADANSVAMLEEQLRALNAGAEILKINHGKISADRLFGRALVDPKTGNPDLPKWLNADAHRLNTAIQGKHERLPKSDARIHFSGDYLGTTGTSHGANVGTWLIEETIPVDWKILSPRIGAVLEKFGDKLLRLKGVVWTVDDPRPLVIHGVQRIFHAPTRLEKWPNAPKTALVAIGNLCLEPAVGILTTALQESVAKKVID
ncbi:GTP-binding protein [Rhodobacteraceae bacterium Araon29]